MVDLLPPEQCPRMPTAEEALTVILGVELPRLILPAGGADGHLRVRVALKAWAS